MNEEHPKPSPHKHRQFRRLAWAAFYSAAAETFVLLRFISTASVEQLNALTGAGAFILASYGLWMAMIGAYMGFTAVRDGWAKQ